MIVKIMGLDAQPWVNRSTDIPDQIVLAVRGGFGLNLRDFDARTTEWKTDDGKVKWGAQ